MVPSRSASHCGTNRDLRLTLTFKELRMQRSGSGRLRNTGNDHGPGRSASVALIFGSARSGVLALAATMSNSSLCPLGANHLRDSRNAIKAARSSSLTSTGCIPPSAIASVGWFKMLRSFAASCFCPTPSNDGADGVPLKSAPWHSMQPSSSNTLFPWLAIGLSDWAANGETPANSGSNGFFMKASTSVCCFAS